MIIIQGLKCTYFLKMKCAFLINCLQVHFFCPNSKKRLHSVELDEMEFGSRDTALFFKMRVADFPHSFQFETKQVLTPLKFDILLFKFLIHSFGLYLNCCNFVVISCHCLIGRRNLCSSSDIRK